MDGYNQNGQSNNQARASENRGSVLSLLFNLKFLGNS